MALQPPGEIVPLDSPNTCGRPAADERIMVIGGNSRLGLSLRRILPAEARFAVRGNADAAALRVDAYDEVPFGKGDIAINCVGISQGTPESLREVNTALPIALAERARASGARRFVHISSFSVYGDARHIDAATPEAPKSDYGRSKRDADEALLALRTADFEVAVLRLPALIDVAGPGKLHQLLGIWRRLRYLPIPAGDVRRSMLGYGDAARVAAQVARSGEGGVMHAADPQPFEYRAAARHLSRQGRGFRTVIMPAPFFAVIAKASPGLHASMFTDSLLAESDNLCVRYGVPSTLYDLIAQAAGQQR